MLHDALIVSSALTLVCVTLVWGEGEVCVRVYWGGRVCLLLQDLLQSCARGGGG